MLLKYIARMETKDKIMRLAKEMNVTRNDIIAATGADKSTVSTWFSGKNKPGGIFLPRLCKQLKCDAEWLLDDISGLDTGRISESRAIYAVETSEPDTVSIPYFSGVSLSAGNGSVILHEGQNGNVPFPRSWLQRLNQPLTNLCVIPCAGFSMEPRICDGDLALINLADTAIRDGKVYAINLGNEAKIKRLFKRLDGSIVVCSDNKSLNLVDEQIAPNEIERLKIIGRAVWVGGSI